MQCHGERYAAKSYALRLFGEMVNAQAIGAGL